MAMALTRREKKRRHNPERKADPSMTVRSSVKMPLVLVRQEFCKSMRKRGQDKLNLSPTTKNETIPALDLKAQYASIRDEVLTAVNAVLDSQHSFLASSSVPWRGGCLS